MLGRAMARELGAQGYRVTVVCPGYVRTPMTERSLDDPETAAGILHEIPMGRPGTVEEVAALASLLASPEAVCVNGSVISIDDGRVA